MSNVDTVRNTLPVSIDGRHYQCELSQLKRTPVDSMRQAYDTSQEPSDRSLSLTSVWKRTQEDFIFGAGQEWFDLPGESNRQRWFTSRGWHGFDRRRLTPLNEATLKTGSADTNTNQMFLVAGDNLFWARGKLLSRVITGSGTWSAVAITHAGAINWLYGCSDGTTLYLTDGSNVYKCASGAAATSVFSTEDCEIIGYANGRIIAAKDAELFELSAAGAKTTIHTHWNADWTWSSIQAAPNGIYVSGYAGDTSEIYLVGVVDTTGALDEPIVVCTMPQGESAVALCNYGGLMLIGTTKGFRAANVAEGTGFLHFGPLTTITNGVTAFEPQGEYVWFTWTNYDSNFTGLGRIYLGREVDDLVFVYSSDLMSDANTPPHQGVVGYPVTFHDKRFFVIQGAGPYGEATSTSVTTNEVAFSKVTFGVSELKQLTSVEIVVSGLNGAQALTVTVTSDTGATDTHTSITTNGSHKWAPAAPMQGEWFQLSVAGLDVTRNTDYTIDRWTLRCLPLPFRVDEFEVPLMISESQHSDDEAQFGMIPQDEIEFLEGLYTGRTPVDFIFGGSTYTVYVDGIIIDGQTIEEWDSHHEFLNGVVTVKLVTLETS